MTDTPRFAYGYRELAIVADHIRAQRAAGDPILVERDKLPAEDAAIRLRVATTIAVDWQHFAATKLPPLDATTSAERIATLDQALAGHRHRMDRARAAIVAEYGDCFLTRSLPELWALVDMHDPSTARVRPYLHHESCAAAIEAMLWWERRPRLQSIRFLTWLNLELRAMGYAERGRAAA